MANKLSKQIKAYLFYTQESVSEKKLAQFFDEEIEQVKTAIRYLEDEFADDVFSLLGDGGSVRLVLDKKYSDIPDRIEDAETKDLTSAQEEALSCVAYMAPVEKFHIDFIRGVNSRAVLRNLSTRGLVNKSGDTYQLSDDALAHLGITKKEDLPEYQSTREKLREFSAANEAVSENTQ